ncbi:pitrilysin family protein [Acuticoccus sp. I52.16.1]|uniref:M16 family metallopeptidase n=1 Tax=Acuticoccus sp. I52.16.1 TaxID=2928472 RepID=UPI001FD30E06|nr:pitrilysin family protein [Acuticoccus sp. I52.16.1]UOM33364.1 insulinase family protein [Acuticoccus sp. I52.16.1]
MRILTSTLAAIGLLTATIGSASAIDIQEVTSPGGIKAWLVSDDTVPLVAVDFAFAGAGSAQDPEDKTGRASLLSSMLDEGAADYDSVAFQTALRDSAVRISFDPSRDHFYGDMQVISANLERGFDLLSLAVTQPRFDEEALGRMKAALIANLRRELNDPDTIAGRLWAETAFPGHPYGRPANGTPESLGTMTRDDLVAAQQTFGKDNLMVAVVGDIDAATLGPLLDRAFGDLPDTAAITPVADIEAATGQTANVAIPTPQTSIRFGGPGIPRHDDDFVPAYVMNHILGGGAFSSWLFEEVREKRGLAYSVYSYVVPFDHAAVFGGGTATRNEKAMEAVEVILQQLERMAEDGPTEAELDDAKAYLTGSYALRFGSSNSTARQLLAIQLEFLGLDYIDTRNAMIEAVTLQDVRRAAGRILGEGKPTVAVVGAPAG